MEFFLYDNERTHLTDFHFVDTPLRSQRCKRYIRPISEPAAISIINKSRSDFDACHNLRRVP
jgi:hypothetical protein